MIEFLLVLMMCGFLAFLGMVLVGWCIYRRAANPLCGSCSACGEWP